MRFYPFIYSSHDTCRLGEDVTGLGVTSDALVFEDPAPAAVHPLLRLMIAAEGKHPVLRYDAFVGLVAVDELYLV